MNQDVPENTEVTDDQNVVNVPCRKLTQLQSEELIQLTKKYYLLERDCREKYHETVSSIEIKIYTYYCEKPDSCESRG